MKKFVSTLMASVMLMLVIGSTAAMAATTPNAVQRESTSELSQELINKANPYIKLQSQTFTLSEEASKNLTEDELGLVNKALDSANNQAKNISGDVTVTTTDNNSLKVVPTNKFSTASINTSSYWDYELLWWGYRIYFSHQLINDIKSKALYAGGIGAISGSTLTGILSSLGLPGWIGGIVVGIFLVKGASIVYADNGRGVYIDAFWAGDPASQAVNFVTAKVYGA
ncbi:hypothetical protein [Paenibacillus peoriae]|jgi:hypothetical protein|uniref:hypothetical protein n=1 Tax=Paenibacillus peoriae TaxID=59893 RepID=UPI00096F0B5B|nr:hypothetical protein [Paenibacillus peoriae]OMF26111.1 hypothetical protein BK134_23005 [Paenibacillus peoriae]